MRLTWKRAAIALGGLALLGALVMVSGVVPIRASSGHWPVTRWLLEFGMARSVSTHALGIEAPELDDPALVLRGAGHYELGCSPCHGHPGGGRSEVVLEMTPSPPLMRDVLHLWSPAELFYIVRHGIKFTAMPAWPVRDREDEVWAMVAFLLRMEELDEAGYLRLARGEIGEDPEDGLEASGPLLVGQGPADPEDASDAPAVVLEVCGACHGMDGRGRGFGAFPSLAGQTREYLENSLLAYAEADRLSGPMHVVAARLDRSEVAEVAAWFAAQGPDGDVLATAEVDPELRRWVEAGLPRDAGAEAVEVQGLVQDRIVDSEAVQRGALLARHGLPALEVPACVACHGPTETGRNPAYPILAGQYARYLAGQLELFRAESRGGTEYVELMHAAVREMEEGQIDDLAAYYASLGRDR